MSVTTSPIVYVAIAVAVIVVAVVVFLIVRRYLNHKKEEAERMERIMNTPLETFGDTEAENLASKYENK